MTKSFHVATSKKVKYVICPYCGHKSHPSEAYNEAESNFYSVFDCYYCGNSMHEDEVSYEYYASDEEYYNDLLNNKEWAK